MDRSSYGGSKRKRGEREPDNLIGIGHTVSHLNGSQESDKQQDVGLNARQEETDNKDDSQGWEKVDRSAKRQKKSNANYPAISHSAHARLQSFVKISDLQNLILYLLADGNAPQWVSVRHHGQFEKVVVVMVPGLEAAMFDGNIPLEQPQPAMNGSHVAVNTAVNTVADMPHAASIDGAVKAATNKGETAYQRSPRKLNLSPDDYYPTKLTHDKLPDPLQPLADIFDHIWPIKTPGEYNRMHSPLYAMLNSPIPKPKEDKTRKGPKPPAEGKTWQNKRTPITDFLATPEELADNNFAIHPAHLQTQEERDHEIARRHKACQAPEDGWVDILSIDSAAEGAVPDASIEAGSVLAGRNLYVVDCEMVTTTRDKFALARISLIDWSGAIILDECVKPPDPVTDYLTQYSGMTASMLDAATLTLPDIQTRLRSLLTPHTILAGHSLDSDLKALKVAFPFVIDTALLYPHPKGPPQKSSLKWLSQKYLSREIQNRGPGVGHDSVEDAQACLDLVRQKCEKGKAWGTPEATGEPIFKRLARSAGHATASKFSSGVSTPSKGRTGAVVDWGEPLRGFGSTATVSIACENDDDVVAGVCAAVLGAKLGGGAAAAAGATDAAAKDIPPNGCDFVWARLRELEAHRGWWNRTKSADAKERLAKTLAGQVQNSQSATDLVEEGVAGSLSTANGDTTLPEPTETATNSSPSTSPNPLAGQVSQTIAHIKSIWSALPARTAFIVYSGSGDPRELSRLQALHAQFRKAYDTMKWDQLPVKWTDVEEQALKVAAMKARSGVGFVAVK